MLVERGPIPRGECCHCRGPRVLLVREKERQVAWFDFT
jgi:hypothetical protein